MLLLFSGRRKNRLSLKCGMWRIKHIFKLHPFPLRASYVINSCTKNTKRRRPVETKITIQQCFVRCTSCLPCASSTANTDVKVVEADLDAKSRMVSSIYITTRLCTCGAIFFLTVPLMAGVSWSLTSTSPILLHPSLFWLYARLGGWVRVSISLFLL